MPLTISATQEVLEKYLPSVKELPQGTLDSLLTELEAAHDMRNLGAPPDDRPRPTMAEFYAMIEESARHAKEHPESCVTIEQLEASWAEEDLAEGKATQ
jgi:hypothetical protein